MRMQKSRSISTSENRPHGTKEETEQEVLTMLTMPIFIAIPPGNTIAMLITGLENAIATLAAFLAIIAALEDLSKHNRR